MKKLLFIIPLVILLVLVGWKVRDHFADSVEVKTAPRGARALAVVLEPVRTMTLRHTAEFTGTLESSARFVVAPKISGRLNELSVDIGDTVTNGQVIAEIDSHEYAQAVSEAQAVLEVARATVAEARSTLSVNERNLQRSTSLRKQNAISQSELDQAQAEYDSSKARLEVALAQVRQREALLEAAKVRLAYTSIQARWDGKEKTRVVGERFIDEGDMIDANAPIVSVVAMDPLLAVINVIERDYPAVEQGQAAEILLDARPGQVFQGRVARLAPVLQESSRQGRVEILVPNPDGLLAPGMFARVRLSFARHQDATAVPVSAVARRNGKEGVFLAVDDRTKARFVPVTLGIADNGWVEVLGDTIAELHDGRVVTLGKHLLEDGGAIRVPAATPAATPTAPAEGQTPEQSGKQSPSGTPTTSTGAQS